MDPGGAGPASGGRKRRLRSAVNPMICLAIAASLLGLSEGVLRLVAIEYHPRSPIIIWTRLEDRKIETGQGMYRFHPYWFWEPRPGAEVNGCPGERINRAGYRGAKRPRASEQGTLRIDDYHPNVAGHELYGKFLAENTKRLLGLGAETKDAATSTGE